MTFDIREYFKTVNVLDHGYVSLVNGPVEHPLLTIVNAARVSYLKSSDELKDADRKLIRYLIEHKHLATLRHTYLSFRVKAPIFVFRQMHKYSVGSHWVESVEMADWNEASGRYVEFKPEFHTPLELRAQSLSSKQGSAGRHEHSAQLLETFIDSQQESYGAYLKLVAEGVSKEQARMVLPASLYSEAYWTVSLAAIRHVLSERLKPDAQAETREYAVAIKSLLPFCAEVLP